jgi:hypothetical protein
VEIGGSRHLSRSHISANLGWTRVGRSPFGGDAARLGPQASGFLHRLVDDAPRPVDVLVPVGRSARVGGDWHFSRERPGARSARSMGAPPHLTVEDTVLDLSTTASEADLIALVTQAVQSRRTTPRRLLKAVNERSRCKHRRLRHGLPYTSDVGYDDYQVLVELDGRTGHEGVGRFRDMNRDNQFSLIEWITLRYGWYDVVHRPCLVAFQIATALVARGWDGIPTRCRRCLNTTDLDLCG